MSPLWPIHPPPHPDESLASWVRRLAQEYGVDRETFALRMVGLEMGLLDGHDPIDAGDFELLSSGTGVSVEEIARMRLRGLAPWSSPEFPSRAQAGLLVSEERARQTGFSHFLLKKSWLVRGCRVCLAAPEPFARTVWECAAISSCTEHRVMLELFDLHGRLHAPGDRLLASSSELDSMDRRTIEAITTGFVRLPAQVLDAVAWFRLLEAALTELKLPKKVLGEGTAVMSAAWRLSGHDLPMVTGRKYAFDTWLPSVQLATLNAAAHLIDLVENDPPLGRGGFATAFGSTECTHPAIKLSDTKRPSKAVPEHKRDYWSEIPQLINAVIDESRHSLQTATFVYSILSHPNYDEDAAAAAIDYLRAELGVDESILAELADVQPSNPWAPLFGIHIGASTERPWTKVQFAIEY